jgi:hypothetical protein
MRSVFVLIALVVVAGCARNQATTPASSPAQAMTPVTVTRTGGLPGVNDRVTVTADGGWTATDRSGKTRTGRLSAGQLTRLTELSGSGQFAAEATRPTQPVLCMDALAYTVAVSGTTVSYVDCPDSTPPPTTASIVRLVSEAALR